MKTESETFLDWTDVISKSRDETSRRNEEWRKYIGEPRFTFSEDGCQYGIWKVDDTIFTTRILKNGPSPDYVKEYTKEVITMLQVTLMS